jgi:hypothetical protein
MKHYTIIQNRKIETMIYINVINIDVVISTYGVKVKQDNQQQQP